MQRDRNRDAETDRPQRKAIAQARDQECRSPGPHAEKLPAVPHIADSQQQRAAIFYQCSRSNRCRHSGNLVIRTTGRDCPEEVAFKTVVQQRIGAGHRWTFLRYAAREASDLGGALFGADDVSFPRICFSWRANKLWGRCPRHLSPDRSLCGRDPQGGQARRVAYLWGASRRMVATRLSNSIELLAPCGNGLLALALLRMRGHAHAW